MGLLGAGLCLGACFGQSAPGQSSSSQNASSQSKAVKAGDAEKAEQAYVAGARLLDRQDLAGAQAEFAKAAKLDPARNEYGLALTLTREHRVSELVQRAAKARMLDQPKQAETLLAEAKTLDPTNELVLEHIAGAQSTLGVTAPKTTITPTHETVFAPPIEIQPDPGLRDIHLRGDAKQVITQAASGYGVKAVFDNSAGSEPLPPVRFDLEQTPYAQAMPLLLKMTHMFSVAVDKKLLLIARDTQENRQRLERQVEETIYVPGSTAEQLNELTNIVKNVFDVKQVVIGQSSGTLLVRAPEPTLTALNETLEDLIDGGSEVMIEMKLLSVDKSKTVNTGTQTPTSGGIISVAGEAQSIVSANQSLVQELISSGGYVPTGNVATDTVIEALFLILSGAVQDAKVSGLVALAGNGLTLTGLYLGSGATINFALSESDTRALDDISMRVGDRQTATLQVGERYPITTATYSSGISSATSSALAGVSINGVSASSLLNQLTGSAATIPQVQYEDIGITLKAQPTVLRSGMVRMHIDLKIEALSGVSSDNIPVLTSRVFASDITLPDGSSAVMMSDLSKTESAAIAGLPGLGELPGFQESAADDLKETDSSELVLVVTPRVVRHRKDLMASRRIPFSTSVPQEY
jgi:general secretion pathway protein D